MDEKTETVPPSEDRATLNLTGGPKTLRKWLVGLVV